MRYVALVSIIFTFACVTPAYPQRGDDTAARIRVENRFSGMGIVVVRMLCDGLQVQAIRDVPLNATRIVRLRRATACSSGLHVHLTDVTGHRIYWRSERLPVSDVSLFALTMGATLNLSTFYPLR